MCVLLVHEDMIVVCVCVFVSYLLALLINFKTDAQIQTDTVLVSFLFSRRCVASTNTRLCSASVLMPSLI